MTVDVGRNCNAEIRVNMCPKVNRVRGGIIEARYLYGS